VTADLGGGWVATAYVRPDARRAIAVRLQVVPATRLPEHTSDPLLAVDLQLYDATSAEPLSDRAVTLGIRPHRRFAPAQIAVFRVRDGRAELLSSTVAGEYEAVLIETTAAATLVIADRAALGQAAVPATVSESPVAVGSPAPLLTRAPLPARISIPVIEVEAPVVPVGLEPGGNMASPTDGHLVGWFEPGPRPGEPSNAVLDGHVDWSGQPAVFWRLRELKSGDEIVVRSGLELQFRYVVTDVQHYRAAEAPLDIVFGATPTATLTLITCGGEFDRASRSYSDRIVVKARGA
jgi:LPXTG-site transpeptidase (sortase) family protein